MCVLFLGRNCLHSRQGRTNFVVLVYLHRSKNEEDLERSHDMLQRELRALLEMEGKLQSESFCHFFSNLKVFHFMSSFLSYLLAGNVVRRCPNLEPRLSLFSFPVAFRHPVTSRSLTRTRKVSWNAIRIVRIL